MSQAITRSSLDDLRSFDLTDLAAGAGALQLLPENADRLVRLEMLADWVVSLATTNESRSKVSYESWYPLVNDPPVADASTLEDPFNCLFTEVLTFHGGCNVVFPGLAEDATFILRQLFVALFHGEPQIGDDSFRGSAIRIIQSVLVLSNEIARRASLPRGLPPASGAREECVVPDLDRFEMLKSAVTFSDATFAALLRRAGATPHDLAPLTQHPGGPSHAEVGRVESLVASRPILRIANRWIVISPTCLLGALRHSLLCMAVQQGLQDSLSAKYRQAVFFSVRENLRRLGLSYQGAHGLTDPQAKITEGLFTFDTDKVIRVAVITDSLREYDSSQVYGRWPEDGIMEQVHNSLLEVEQGLFSRGKQINEVMDLVIIQGVGRSYGIGLEDPLEPVRSLRLIMRASELDIIPLLSNVGPLTLWQFAQASEEIRQRTQVFAIDGTLDEFALYRRHDSSYYMSDGRPPNYLQILPGMALDLRLEACNRFDFHSVHYPGSNWLVEVALLNPDRAIPIYLTVPRSGAPFAQLVERLPLPVWVSAPENLPGQEYRIFYVHFVEMVAYWIWQFTEGLAPLLNAAAQVVDYFEIGVELIPSREWMENDSEKSPDQKLVCEPISPENFQLTIGPAIARSLERADNAGEREIMLAVLIGFRNWGKKAGVPELGDLSDHDIRGLLDRFAPLGRKKKLLSLRGNVNPTLIEKDLPKARDIQAFDDQQVLDRVGAYCSDELGVPKGPIAVHDRSRVLNQIVMFLYCELERLVGTLSPEGLLENLVSFNEALVHRDDSRRLNMPTIIACYGSVAKMAERLQRELPEAAAASIASRFLIEYVVTRPPCGPRPFSFGVYDRLLALASRIVGMGNLSDSIHYNLSNQDCTMLPSGRLAVARGNLEAALEAYSGVHARGEIARSEDGFERHWRTSQKMPTAEIQAITGRMQEATEIEFGNPLKDLLDCLQAMVNLGLQMQDEPRIVPRSHVQDLITKELGWDQAKANQVLDCFILRPRADFLNPREGFAKSDVFPWRFNRALSYIRKPILSRTRDGVEELVWGFRHTHTAIDYLVNLCYGGRLKARSKAMQQLMGELHSRDGDGFNRLVAELYGENPKLMVRTRVKKIGGERLARCSGEDLGDIDVLVADPERCVIQGVETKDFSAALSPAELSNELEELFGSEEKPGAVLRHIERVRWVQDHLEMTLKWLGLGSAELSKWKVQPLVVLERELISPFIERHPIEIISLRELRERLKQSE